MGRLRGYVLLYFCTFVLVDVQMRDICIRGGSLLYDDLLHMLHMLSIVVNLGPNPYFDRGYRGCSLTRMPFTFGP